MIPDDRAQAVLAELTADQREEAMAPNRVIVTNSPDYVYMSRLLRSYTGFLLRYSKTPVYDTCQEMYFQYAKIQPFLAEFRRRMDMPEFLLAIERLIEGSEAGRERVRMMRKNLSVMAGIGSETSRTPS